MSVFWTTHSETQLYRNCQKRHGFAYIEGLRPDRESAPLRYGTLMHAVIAAGWRTDGDPEEASCEFAEEEMLRFADLAESMDDQDALTDLDDNAGWVRFQASNYWRTIGREDKRRYVVLGEVEHRFEVLLSEQYGRRGSIDLPLYDPETQHLVVMDHKTTAGAVDGFDRALQLDPQTTGYLYALDKGIAQGEIASPGPITGFEAVYNILRKKAPREPKINKDGTVSVAAIDTTAQLYSSALCRQVEAGKDVTEKQEGRLLYLEEHAQPYIKRFRYMRNSRRMLSWVREETLEASRMAESYRMEAFRVANPSYCTGPGSSACPYFMLCESQETEETRVAPPYGFVRVNPHDEETRK